MNKYLVTLRRRSYTTFVRCNDPLPTAIWGEDYLRDMLKSNPDFIVKYERIYDPM